MKTKKKALLLTACAVLLVVATVFGTLAYLTAQTDKVDNTFTMGSNVALKLDEADTDENGVVLTKDGQPVPRVQKNEYKLMPAHQYVKDPTVHVTGEQCYVFVTVDDGLAQYEADKTVAAQIVEHNWVKVDGYDNLYVYVGTETGSTKAIVSGTEANPTDLVVFDNFTLKNDLTYNDLTAAQTAHITINAYAIQADGFAKTSPADIWTATGFTGAVKTAG